MSQSKKICIAIFGIGRIGTTHIQNAVRNPRLSIKYIVNTNYEGAVRVKRDCLLDDSVQIMNANDTNTILEDESVEVIMICTPTEHHASLIAAACKAGKAIFCEKPVAATVEEVKRCYAFAKHYGQLLYCAYNRRFDPSMREMSTRVKAGEVGEIKSIKTTSRDHPPPSIDYLKSSGGIFFDCATHDLDMICWIMGGAPSTVYCQAHAFNPEIGAINDYDQIGIMMQFPGGAIANIDINRHATYGYDQRLEVFGSKCMLECRNHFPTAIDSLQENVYFSGRIVQSCPRRYNESFKLEFEHFLNVYQGIEPALDVSEEDCVRVTRLSECCEQSLKTGKPISFKMDY